ncbi:kinase-like protein [Athelia psychrophila]|uniref:Kinase-like protein n=1 Tax=Athelia psychrophila TaxID=1759441 RepID=A0A166PA32_9AGAM|nr:kinase-like protein [Fibularhizoctonia sp. CBS 109695]
MFAWRSSQICEFASTVSLAQNRLTHVCQVKEIAEGLDYLHSEGIVHADLRCDNILINDQGCALLTGFARAKKIGVSGYSTPLFTGSTRHLAPEFFRNNVEVDVDTIFCKATDIYAFAMVCFEVFTGDKPFSTLRIDYRVISALLKLRRPEAAPTVRDRIPHPIWEIMCGCWAQDSRQRPPSTGDVMQALSTVNVQ